jgi:hypothetical protein
MPLLRQIFGCDGGGAWERILVGKSEKKPLGRCRRRSEDNVTEDIKEIRCVGVDCGLIWFRIGISGVLL